jgi:hypothetical protein
VSSFFRAYPEVGTVINIISDLLHAAIGDFVLVETGHDGRRVPYDLYNVFLAFSFVIETAEQNL